MQRHTTSIEFTQNIANNAWRLMLAIAVPLGCRAVRQSTPTWDFLSVTWLFSPLAAESLGLPICSIVRLLYIYLQN